jgi:hypothetical protein
MPKDVKAQIERNFRSYPVEEERDVKMKRVRDGCKFLADIINEFAPDGREKSLALTNLEQVMFWANAAIARPPEGTS